MSLAAPIWFWLALGVAASVVALHFLARRLPRQAPFPTARFIPARAVRWPAPAPRPSDLLLLAMRVAAVLLIGLAFARPVVDRTRPVRRVVLADVGPAADRTAVLDTARALTRVGDTLVSEGSGWLSAGLVRAARAARAIGHTADSLELVIVSPLVRGGWDRAVDSVRGVWTGRARLVETRPVPAVTGPAVFAPGVPEPVRAAAALAHLPDTGDPVVRVVAGLLTPADSAWARAGGTVVRWPDPSATDTVSGVVHGEVALVAALARTPVPDTGTVAARWIDGTAAATDVPLGNGCVRTVGVTLPAAGDVAIRPAAVHLVRGLLTACGAGYDRTPLDSGARADLAGAGPLAAAGAPAPAGRVPAVSWLLGLGLLVLLLEPLARRRGDSP